MVQYCNVIFVMLRDKGVAVIERVTECVSLGSAVMHVNILFW